MSGTRREFLLASAICTLPATLADAQEREEDRATVPPRAPALATNRVVSVKDYGAKGDGRTDDTEAVQRAIDHLASGDVLLFPPGEYGFQPRELKLTHPRRVYKSEPEANQTLSYLGVWKLCNKTRVSVICRNATFKELSCPTQYGTPYSVFLCQNLDFCSFDVGFQGHVTLADKMPPESNPLDRFGAKVVSLYDNCRFIRVNGHARSAREILGAYGYDAKARHFKETTRPGNIHADVFVEDCKYGTRYALANSTQTRITGVNCKRVYRLDGGVNHHGDVNYSHAAKDTWFGYGHWCVMLLAGHFLGNVNLRVNMHRCGHQALHLEADGMNARMEGVRVELQYSGGGTIDIWNAGPDDSRERHQRIDQVVLSGYIRTTSHIPIRIRAVSNQEHDSKVRRLHMSDLVVKCTAERGVEEFIRFDGMLSSSNSRPIEDLRMTNVTLIGTSNGGDNDSDGVKNGVLHLKGCKDPILTNVQNNLRLKSESGESPWPAHEKKTCFTSCTGQMCVGRDET